MDSSKRLVPSCGTSSTAAPEVLCNLQMTVPAVKQEEVDITYEKDIPCSDFMYPSGPLESSVYVNYYDSKDYVLEQLKKEIPEKECPQSGDSMNNKEVFENKELLEGKQKIKIENTEEGLLLNIKEEDEDIEYPCGIKTVWIEEQRVSASDRDASARDALLTPQIVECKSSGRISENGVNKKSAQKKEADRRYRERHREEINQRRRENRLNRQSLQPVASCAELNSMQSVRHDDASSKQAKKEALRKERDRRYRERNREKIKQRKKESRQRNQYMQQIPTASDTHSSDTTQQHTEQVPDEQPTAHCFNINIDKHITHFNSWSQHDIQ